VRKETYKRDITRLLLCYDRIKNVVFEEVCVYLHIETANEMYTSEKKPMTEI